MASRSTTSTSVDLCIHDILIDRDNPRVAHLEHHLDTEHGIILSLNEGADVGVDDAPDRSQAERTTYGKLRSSIRAHGGIIHPIIVRRNADGQLICIEGNTRLAIYKKFHENGEPGDWLRIPCIVFENASASEVDAIRLQAHLVGPRPWSPYAKARYLHTLSQRQHMKWKDITNFAGGNVSDIQKQVQAYEDMETHYRGVIPSDDEFDIQKFSGFRELQTPAIESALSKAGFTKRDFAQWIHEDKLKPLGTIRSLPAILGDSEARHLFLGDGGTAKQALLHLEKREGPEPGLETIPLDRIARHLRTKLTSPRVYDEIQESEQSILLDELEHLADALDSIFNAR